VLGDGEPPLSLLDGYECSGDESRLCCDLPAFGQTVVARGMLWRHNGWRLQDLTICEVDPSNEVAKTSEAGGERRQ
jgi:hypothetical protein